MRYAIVSDIHGNLPAWHTVLADIALRKVDRIVCLGDVVGYGPQPAETLRSVHEHVHLMVLGNHDAVMAGRLDPDAFNDRAKAMIAWTAARLGARARDLFKALPLVLVGKNFRFAHGAFVDPAEFDYVTTPEEAAASFHAVPEQLLFCGHSHLPELYVTGRSGVAHPLAPQDFTTEEGKRYLVNVGSVGFPRGGDPRASYVVFDDEKGTVRFYRVSYDFEAFRAAAERNGLGPEQVPQLRDPRLVGLGPAREALDFSPGGGRRATGAVVEQDASQLLRKSAARWKRVAAAAVLFGLVSVGLGVAVALRSPRQGVVAFPPDRAPAVVLAGSPLGDGNCLPPLAPSQTASFSAAPYRVVLGNASQQKVALAPMASADRDCVVIASLDETAEIAFEAPPIACMPGDRLEVIAKAAFPEDFEGALALVVRPLRDDGGAFVPGPALLTKNFHDQVGIRDENLPLALRGFPNKDGWWIARGTTAPAPNGTRLVLVEVVGKFTGEIRIGGIVARSK
ncbi:MAG: metallophosphoesterase family protein [Kiritimatiellia bacterium]